MCVLGGGRGGGFEVADAKEWRKCKEIFATSRANTFYLTYVIVNLAGKSPFAHVIAHAMP